MDRLDDAAALLAAVDSQQILLDSGEKTTECLTLAYARAELHFRRHQHKEGLRSLEVIN